MNKLLLVLIILVIISIGYYLWGNLFKKDKLIEGLQDKTINNFFAAKTLNRHCYSGSTHKKVPLSEEKVIPTDSTKPYKLQYEYKINDQNWGNLTYGRLILKNITTGKNHQLVSNASRKSKYDRVQNNAVAKGTADISDYVKAGDKVKIQFTEDRCWSGHTLYWYYYKNMNLTYREANRPSLRQPRQPITAYQTFTGNCMPSTTLTVIGKTPQKPKKGHILQNVRNWAGKWDNFVMSFVIKPLSKGSGWRNIIHNTFDGANSNYTSYSRYPGIWMRSNTTKLHIKWYGNQGTDPSYQLPLNKKSRITLIINGADYTCIIRDENDDIKYEKTEKISAHSPPNKPWGDGSKLPLLDYGGSMQRMPTGQPKLGECEGDCDRNSDCQTGLKCFQRSYSSQQVPGCSKGGSGDIGSHDYCYYDPPNKHSFYMSDPWYEPFNCEISELILDSNVSQPTCKFLEKQAAPPATTKNAFYFACERKTFMEHHLAAIAMGGHLASIHNAEENEAIRKIIPPCGKVWIGAVRKRPGSGDSAEKWTWTDGSKWDYANWRSGEPNDCCKGQTGNMGEVHAEIQKKDGKWNDIMHKYNNDVKKFGAVYKLNATYENSWPAGIIRLNTDGMNSWAASKKLCEGEANSGNAVGAHGTLASRREVLDFIKGKPESGDSWTPVSDGDNVWLQVGMRNDRGGLTPSFAMTHQEIPDVAYTKSGDAAKPSWGITKTKRTYRKSLFCKKPPDGMTWDNDSEKFVKVKLPDQTSSTGSLLPSAITTQKHTTGEKTLAVGNDHKFKVGQTIVIGVPPNTETRTIVRA